MKSLIFIEDPQEIEFLFASDFNFNKLTIVALSIRAQAYLQNKSIKHYSSLEYFDNNAHERCLSHSDKVYDIIENNFNYSYKGKSFFAVINWFANRVNHSSSYIIFLIEVVTKALKTHKPDMLYISEFTQQNYSGYLIKKGEYYHPIICEIVASKLGIEVKKFRIQKNQNLELRGSYVEEKNQAKNNIKLPHLRNNKKTVLFTNMGYNMFEVLKDIKKKHKGINFFSLSNTGRNRLKSFIYKFTYNLHFIDYQVPKHIDNIIDFSKIDDLLCTSLFYDGIEYYPIINKKLVKSIYPDVERMAFECDLVDNLISELKPELTLSNHSLGISYAVGEICNRHGLDSMCISHGTVVIPKNNIEEITNKRMGKTMILNNYPAVAVQSRWAQEFLGHYSSGSKIINTGPLIFTKLDKNPRSPNHKRKILHASTFKNKSNIKFWSVETPCEYISTLRDLIKIFGRHLEYDLVIKLHPSIFYETDIKQLTEFINPPKNVKLSSRKISYELKDTNLLISYSSTVIEEALLNKIPVLLYDKWERYCHYTCHNLDLNPFIANTLYYATKPESVSKNLNELLDVQKNNNLDWSYYHKISDDYDNFETYLNHCLY